MIIGSNKEVVIDNIKKAIQDGELNRKVEVNDPKLTSEEQQEIIKSYIESQGTISYKIKNKIARRIVKLATKMLNKETEIIGLENAKNIKTGAIITSNHFNPIDNTIIQKLSRKLGKKRLYIVNQITNLAMDGFIGFMMNYTDTIPISKQIGYLKKEFPHIIQKILEKKQYILIYPEEEMWFNYKKPRTLKPGSYYLAAKNNVPIIPCFVEMVDLGEKDNDEFNKVKYILHVLKPIYPDAKKTVKENTEIMMCEDYNQKKESYEKAYGKKLDYKFEEQDIAGWIK